jgi:hypothetical protein
MDEENKNRTDGDENNAQRTISSICIYSRGETENAVIIIVDSGKISESIFLTSYRFSSRQTVNNTAFARESV